MKAYRKILYVTFIIIFIISIDILWAQHSYRIERLADLPTGVVEQAQLRPLLNGKIVVFGGLFQWNNPCGYDRVQKYDPVNNEWNVIDSPYYPHGMWGATADIGSNGLIYLTPGSGPNANNGWGIHRNIIEYNPATGHFTERAALHFRDIWSVSICRGGDGFLYTFGGWDGNGRSEVYRYDPINDEVVHVTNLVGGNRNAITSLLGPDGNIYLFGGGNWDKYHYVIEVFDVAQQTCSVLPTQLPFDGAVWPIAWLGDDELIYLLAPDSAGALYVFNPVNHQISLVDTGLYVPRMAKPTVDLETGEVYLVGGRDEAGNYSVQCYKLTPFESSSRTDNWFTLGHDYQRTSFSTTTINNLDEKLSINITAPGGFASSPIISDDIIYAGGIGNILYAYNKDNKNEIWHYTHSSNLSTGSIWQNMLVVSTNGSLLVLDKQNGNVIRTINHGGMDQNDVCVINDGIAYVSCRCGIFAADLVTGNIVWDTSLSGYAANTPTLSEDGTKIVTGIDSNGKYYCLSASNGSILWEYATSGQWRYKGSSIVGNNVYTFIPTYGSEGKLISLNLNDGTENWSSVITNVNNPSSFLATKENYLIISTGRYIKCYDTNGNFIWEKQYTKDAGTPVISSNNYVIIPCFDGNIYALDLDSGSQELTNNVGLSNCGWGSTLYKYLYCTYLEINGNWFLKGYGSEPSNTNLDWQLHLTASVGSTNDLDNYAGVAATATNGFDSEFDIPEVAPPPSNYVQLYFPHPEWNHLLGNNFTHDVRATTDLSDSHLTWDFEVSTDQSGSQMTLVINPENVPSGFGLLLKNLDYGSTQDLWKNATYSYTATAIGHFQLMVGDSTIPSITVTSPNGGEVLSQSDYTITWTASDGSGLESFDLAYSTDNGMTYTTIATVDGDQNSYIWQVPTVQTYWALIKITATDSMGNVEEDVSDDVFTISAHEQCHSYNAGWNMISVPLIPDDELAEAVIGDDVINYYYLYQYNNAAGYFISDSVINGIGYWLATVDDPLEVDVQGTTVTDEAVVPLVAGWNIIGNPLIVSVPKSQINVVKDGTTLSFNDAVNSAWITNALYTYGDAGYQSADALDTWTGYWLGTLVDGVSLVISPPTLSVPQPPLAKVTVDSGWTITLEARSNESSDLISAFGVNQTATNGFDPAFDDPEPPLAPSGNGIRLYFPHPEWGVILGDKFNKDIQSPLEYSETRSWSFEIQRSGSVSLCWDVSSVEDHSFILTDLDAGITIDMATLTSYSYTSEQEIRHFRIDVTNGVSDVHNNEDLIPADYELSQNYPNPFNPQTEIRYQLPKSGNVRLIVYNHLGQKVRTLVNSQKSAGEYTVTWNGRDDNGKKVTSGIYFYKMQVGDDVLASRKMLMIK